MIEPCETIQATSEQQATYAEQSTETIQDVVLRLAALHPFEYEKVRADEAEKLDIKRLSVLDKSVEAARKQTTGNKEVFPAIPPWHEPVNGALLLDEISSIVRRFIVLDDQQADAVAIWIMHTWFIDVVGLTPRLIIDAPEKACGKSQLLILVGHMCNKPLPASNATVPAIFRAVEKWRPTILIDEADTFFGDNKELAGMINSGYARDGYVLRCEAIGDSYEPRSFSVFSPKAIAGIALKKHLPDATLSRGIAINLRRKLHHESVEKLLHADRNSFFCIKQKLLRFAINCSEQVENARPHLPDALESRQEDNWYSLFAIAECVGEEWVKRINNAALKLSLNDTTISMGSELLSDIQDIFETRRIKKIFKADKIFKMDLLLALIEYKGKSWATYNRGQPLTAKQLTTNLSSYEIKIKSVRIGYDVHEGYELCQFTDVFERYLTLSPPDLPLQTYNSAEINTVKDLSVDESVRAEISNPYILTKNKHEKNKNKSKIKVVSNKDENPYTETLSCIRL